MLVVISEKSQNLHNKYWQWTCLDGFYFYGKMDDHFGPGKIYASKQDWDEIERKIKKCGCGYYHEHGFFTRCFVEGYAPMGEIEIYMWESKPTRSQCGLIIDSHDEKAYKFARAMQEMKVDVYTFLDPSPNPVYLDFLAKLEDR